MENTEKKSKTYILHIVYLLIIALIIGGGVYGYFYITKQYETEYQAAYNEALSKQVAEYESSKAKYEKAYDIILKEEADWQKELENKQAELNRINEELTDIYTKRQAEIDAENARFNALSLEEQQAELTCYAYNEMVATLRATNSEYAALYVEFSNYLLKDIYNLGREESLAYTELYQKKAEIEKAYLKDHPDLLAKGE